jgi:hypothetical protein
MPYKANLPLLGHMCLALEFMPYRANLPLAYMCCLEVHAL